MAWALSGCEKGQEGLYQGKWIDTSGLLDSAYVLPPEQRFIPSIGFIDGLKFKVGETYVAHFYVVNGERYYDSRGLLVGILPGEHENDRTLILDRHIQYFSPSGIYRPIEVIRYYRVDVKRSTIDYNLIMLHLRIHPDIEAEVSLLRELYRQAYAYENKTVPPWTMPTPPALVGQATPTK